MLESIQNINTVFVFVAGLAAFLLQFGTLIWRINQAVTSINSKIEEVEHGYEIEIFKLREEILKSQLDTADNYIRKDSFRAFMTNMDARLIRLESKLDSAISKIEISH